MHILSKNKKHFVILVIIEDAGDYGVGSLIPRLSPQITGPAHMTCMHDNTKLQRDTYVASLIPRPSPAPVFDRLQYTKTEEDGLVNLTGTGVTCRHAYV